MFKQILKNKFFETKTRKNFENKVLIEELISKDEFAN